MKYRTLGRTGVQVSVAGIGGNQFGTVVDARGTAAILDRALELGVNFVDTAESYGGGTSEEAIGKAIARRRGDFVIATKTGAPAPNEAGGRLTRKRIIERLEASLTRLATDYVDVYYFHHPDPLTPLDESLRTVEDAVRAGKVRYCAVSNHPAWQVAEAAGISERRGLGGLVASQVRYNLLDRSAELEMLPACAHLGISIVPYSPLAGGFLTGKYRRNTAIPEGTRLHRVDRMRAMLLTEANYDALERFEVFASARGHSVGELAVSWLLAHPEVCSVIGGVTSVTQVEANARATEWELSADEVTELAI